FRARVVRVFSGDKAGDVSYEQASDWIIDGLKEASAYAASQGVTLCLENHGLFAGKAEQVLNVIREVGSEHLRSTFDTGNFLLVDESPSEAAVKLADHISHVHLKDFALVEQDYEGKIYTSLSGQRYAGFAPGEGSVDLPFILGHLKDNGYNGRLTVEYEGDEEQKQGSERSILNLRRMLSAL
ncbi:sugar phosphate isomerase/epimerase, partial [Paenibacillus sepulcri]|nr:sugar phosphate isomerase/epimerase [Paenibacillus sepulcri]